MGKKMRAGLATGPRCVKQQTGRYRLEFLLPTQANPISPVPRSTIVPGSGTLESG